MWPTMEAQDAQWYDVATQPAIVAQPEHAPEDLDASESEQRTLGSGVHRKQQKQILAWARLPCHASFNSCSLVWDMTWKHYRRREKYWNTFTNMSRPTPRRPRFQC